MRYIILFMLIGCSTSSEYVPRIVILGGCELTEKQFYDNLDKIGCPKGTYREYTKELRK